MLRQWMLLSGCAGLLACTAPVSDASGTTSAAAVDTEASRVSWPPASRVLLISVDGYHAFDLDAYVAAHPASALAGINQRGVKFSNASASRPSDSFPATMAMVTGGSPATTGVFYDISWDDRLSPPGSDCSTRGTTVTYNQLASFDPNVLDTTINPDKLPRDADKGCAPVYPHSYLKVNTVYEVMKAAGMRTAAAEKHATYEILNGPSGTGVDDLYTPEAEAGGAKKSITLTEQNDDYKVNAVLNQIRGYDHTGATHVGVPAIFGMNFQAINIAQKIAGYADGAGTPTPALAQAFDYVDNAIGRMVTELQAQNLLGSTRIIFTSKSGNSPVDPATRRAVDPAQYTTILEGIQPGLVGHVTADTVALVWLTDHSRAAEAVAAITANAAALGVESILSGSALDSAFAGVFRSDPARKPDIIVQPTHGVVYTTATKLADHGGFTEDDLHIPLVVSQPGLHAATVSLPVDLRQVAPTILLSVGLAPWSLDAVRREWTLPLPGVWLVGR